MRQLLALLFLLVLLVGLSPATQAAGSAGDRTPDLPAALQAELNNGKMVFLDFYSQYCGVCIKMDPHLQELEKSTADKIDFLRIDISDEKNKEYLDLYGINGTPTYILFDAQGKPVYKMENRISSLILKLQLLRWANQLKKVELPDEIELLKNAQSTGKIILVSFQNADCEACTKVDAYLTVFENASDDKLTVVRLNPDDMDARGMAKELSVNPVEPFYLLMDASGQELYRYEGAMEPKMLWEIIQTFTVSGV